MVKQLNKKPNKNDCSQASWEQCLNFFQFILPLFYYYYIFFNNTQGTTYIKNIIIK